MHPRRLGFGRRSSRPSGDDAGAVWISSTLIKGQPYVPDGVEGVAEQFQVVPAGRFWVLPVHLVRLGRKIEQLLLGLVDPLHHDVFLRVPAGANIPLLLEQCEIR